MIASTESPASTSVRFRTHAVRVVALVVLAGFAGEAAANPLFWLLLRGSTGSSVAGTAARTAIGTATTGIAVGTARAGGLAAGSGRALVGPVQGSRIQNVSRMHQPISLRLSPDIFVSIVRAEESPSLSSPSSSNTLHFWNGENWVKTPNVCIDAISEPFRADGFLWKCSSKNYALMTLAISSEVRVAIARPDEGIGESSSSKVLHFWNGERWVRTPNVCVDATTDSFRAEGFLWKCGYEATMSAR